MWDYKIANVASWYCLATWDRFCQFVMLSVSQIYSEGYIIAAKSYFVAAAMRLCARGNYALELYYNFLVATSSDLNG